MLAVAQGDEDDDDPDRGLEEDPEGITDVEVAKKRIKDLLLEAQRQDGYQKRLQRKLQKLEKDLSGRREEVETLQRTLQLERGKEEDEKLSQQKEREAKAKAQEERIRDTLCEVLYTKPSTRSAKKGNFELDTVLVSFVKPNETFRYNLAFRTDGDTMVEQLRRSACKYWGVSPDDFILKTMANNKCQDDILVKECFKQGEIAQLRLEKKKCDSHEPPSEGELKAIQAKDLRYKLKKRDPRYNLEGADKIQKFSNNYADQLKKLGGIYFLLKLRDTKPSEHTAKIKFRDIMVYLVLAALTFYVYNTRRPPGHAFTFVRGIEDAMMLRRPVVDPGVPTPPLFAEVNTQDDLWAWLNVTLPNVFWGSTTNDFSTFNYMLGYMSIRVKNVKTSGATGLCKSNVDLLALLENSTCDYIYVDETSEEQSDHNITGYWQSVLNSKDATLLGFRGPADPSKWVSAAVNQEKHKIGSVDGNLQNYDGAGYSVEYRMINSQPSDILIEGYQEDIRNFQQFQWISTATRAVIISFTTYNFHLDMWAASDFLFELPPSASISKRHFVRPFKPRLFETRQELLEAYIDGFRLAIALYILLFVGATERAHKIKNHKAGYLYHVSLNGITDFGAVSCILCMVIWRWSSFNQNDTIDDFKGALQSGFRSFSSKGYAAETILTMEGLLMVFVTYRSMSLTRLSHKVYMLWRTMGEAVKAFAFFMVLFIPPLLGFIFVTKKVFGPHVESFSLLSSTTLSIYSFLRGRLELQTLLIFDAVWALLFSATFYIIVNFLLVNVFLTIVVDSYYIVQLTSNTLGESWDRRKWLSWAVPSVLTSIVQAVLASGSSE